MKEKKSLSTFPFQITMYIILFILHLFVREYFLNLLIENRITSYFTHKMFGTVANIVLIGISIIFIKINKLEQISGLKGTQLTKWYLLLFPLLYLVALNLLFMDQISSSNMVFDLLILLIYTISIGFAEELSIRGFIQSILIKRFGHSKKNILLSVIASSVFFGIIHLIKFDKGIYGEISQIFYAAFIGLMFGMVLVVTKRIFPLIAVHAIIDFAAKLDSVGLETKVRINDPVSLDNAILMTLLVVPCLIYAIVLMVKFQYTKVRQTLS